MDYLAVQGAGLFHMEETRWSSMTAQRLIKTGWREEQSLWLGILTIEIGYRPVRGNPFRLKETWYLDSGRKATAGGVVAPGAAASECN